MSAVPRSGSSRINSNPVRSYISMRAYNNDIFSYTVSEVDFNYVGSLGPVSGATALTCPQGRILVESGKKLYPGANPGISTYMVSVFDYATGLKGFIDPNSTAFTPQNTDRPYYITSPGSNSVDPYPDRAPPVFTRGDVLAQGNFDLSGNMMVYGNTSMDGTVDIDGAVDISGATTVRNGNLSLVTGGGSGGNLIAEKQIRSSTVTAITPASAVTIDATLGQVHTLAADQNTTITTASPNNVPGAVIYVIITNVTGGNITIDFNAGFRTQSAGGQTMGAGTIYVFSFVSDGTNFFQIGATAQNISQ